MGLEERIGYHHHYGNFEKAAYYEKILEEWYISDPSSYDSSEEYLKDMKEGAPPLKERSMRSIVNGLHFGQ